MKSVEAGCAGACDCYRVRTTSKHVAAESFLTYIWLQDFGYMCGELKLNAQPLPPATANYPAADMHDCCERDLATD